METPFPEAVSTEEPLVLNSLRDIPPLGDGMSSTALFCFSDGESYVAGVRDTDKKKNKREEALNHKVWKRRFGPHPDELFHYRYCLPGGRKKKKEGALETFWETALQETEEEAGVLLTKEELFPVHRVRRHGPGRDENDEETGVRADYDHYIFAAFGQYQLRETTDADANDPKWFPLRAIWENTAQESVLASNIKYELGKETPDEWAIRAWSEERDKLFREGVWMFAHVVVLAQALALIGAGFQKYARGKLASAEENVFFEKLALSARDKKTYESIDDLCYLNPALIVEKIIGGKELSEIILEKFPPTYLGAEYFLGAI